MSFLYWLEGLRNPVCDFIFSTITHIGEETIFLVVAILFFWCVNKREGYYILITGLVGTVINQAAKLIFKIPRPWIKDTNFTVVDGAKLEATGYSFPSGHTQNVTGTFGAIGRYSKKRWVRIFSVAIIVLVAFSRMYLGVHTPLDVGVSLLIGILLVFGLYPCFEIKRDTTTVMPIIIFISFLLSFGLLLFVFLMDREGVDPTNLYSGMKNASTLFGCTLALIPVYAVDKKLIDFPTEAKWYSQIIKLVLGLGGVLAIKAGLSSPLEALFGNEFIARGVRYFLIVIFAGIIWPLTFRFFRRLRISPLDRFTEWLKGKTRKNKNEI